MRQTSKKQMPLMPQSLDHPRTAELDAINRILDDNPTISDFAIQDLSHGALKCRVGANGMTAEQVVRTAIIKQMFGYSAQLN